MMEAGAPDAVDSFLLPDGSLSHGRAERSAAIACGETAHMLMTLDGRAGMLESTRRRCS
jgi:hypothetical protein